MASFSREKDSAFRLVLALLQLIGCNHEQQESNGDSP